MVFHKFSALRNFNKNSQIRKNCVKINDFFTLLCLKHRQLTIFELNLWTKKIGQSMWYHCILLPDNLHVSTVYITDTVHTWVPRLSSPVPFYGFTLHCGYLEKGKMSQRTQRFILRGILAIAVILILSVTLGAMVSLL